MKQKLPLYQQVSQFLIHKINKEFQPGDLIPTQEEIASMTNTSLITVKRAISELVTEGHLESIAGKGTFVRKPQIVDTHVGVSSWTQTIEAQGKKAGTAWVKTSKRTPPEEIANALKLKAREKTFMVERLRTIDEKPACLMTNEFSQAFIKDIPENFQQTESLYEWLKGKHGLVAVKSEEEVFARAASKEEIEQLQLEQPIVLVIERVSYLENGNPFEYSYIIAAAERYRYRTIQVNKTLIPEKITSIIKNEIQ